MSVVLPMPFGPMMAMRSPASTLKVTLLSTGVSARGYVKVSFSTFTANDTAFSPARSGCTDSGAKTAAPPRS